MKDKTRDFIDGMPDEMKPLMEKMAEEFQDNWPDASIGNGWPADQHDNLLEVFLIGVFRTAIEYHGAFGDKNA